MRFFLPATKPVVHALAALVFVASCFSAEAERLPLFDAHVHYSEDAWHGLSPQAAVAILERAGVRAAMVSSTPSEGTEILFRADQQRVVPFLRPYRSGGDVLAWPTDPAIRAYVEQKLAGGTPYVGIGEFHLSADDVEAVNVARFAELAAEKGLFFHAHVDSDTMAKLKQTYPRLKMIWAHAGMSEGPAASQSLLSRFDNLWIELSLRSDVAREGPLDPEWRAVFLRYPDRFLVGTDTWIPERWDELVDNAEFTRAWLSELPADVAEQIAYRNGERLFGK